MAISKERVTAALALSAAVAGLLWPIACEAIVPPGFGSPWLRLSFFAAGSVVAAVGAVVWGRAHRQSAAGERRFSISLCQADLHDTWQDEHGTRLPLPAVPPQWSHVLGQVRRAFREHGQRIQDLEHARAATELRCRRSVEEAERVKAVLAGLAEPVLVVDSYDDLVLANASAEQLFGLDGKNVETRAAKTLLRCQKLVDLLLGTARHKTAEKRSEEIEITDAQGRPQWYRVTARRLAAGDDAEGQDRGGAVAVMRNIAEQKALQKRNAEFVSSVSHEMKAPLAGIKAYVELLADGDAEDDETREEFLTVINGQADRLQRLVENLLNLARIEAGVVKVSKEPRSLNEILEEALRVVQPAAEAKGIALVSDLSPMYLGVLADRDMLLQAGINLLSNAVKYTPAGGTVTLRSRMEEGQVRFDVQDTGVGLGPDDCQRVFEKFYRVAKNKDMAAGTGLGLPLAKHIVEDVHGGRLTVESTVGKGSTFTVTLKTKD